ncbi:protein jag [Gloeocapsopsis dulcis]|uniref:RNA-binding protein n=1 Tax=Gloeocapsopsis dulcis AAB1 = 1H9 TaxID=1433147 RepID=A0A6N8FY92_9CHRO|nr:R3H domain-containing nucleic acid-binding protein [Gloeocapsopsis dulcis]MUL37809.1 RNA-binding protein [Gloeocapsopsis dulcis AAB1 = 1H9]WNN89770.1 R3H domain-containing nucleic acid-binding protein [Gloeocapsopsis dulcis]
MTEDTRMQRGQTWVESLLKLMSVSANVEAHLEASQIQDSAAQEPDNYWLTVDETKLSSEQIKTLIGSEGNVLDAIQYLANATLNLHQSQDEQASYTVELDGYRVRRQAEVQAIAQAAAEEVRASGQEVEIKSLSSAERRQVHTFLKSFSDLETFSRGKEPHRHLVVRQLQ